MYEIMFKGNNKKKQNHVAWTRVTFSKVAGQHSSMERHSGVCIVDFEQVDVSWEGSSVTCVR